MIHRREDAYRLQTPADHQSYYDAWAATYDADFALASGYRPPRAVAQAFLELAGPQDTPIADIGCGTGLLGISLGLPDVDGFDISSGMLAAAARTAAYRHLIAADLTDEALPVEREYGGIVSSGTFTRGHLGPAQLRSSLRLGRANALCVVAINAQHFSEAGFASLFDELESSGATSPITNQEILSYDDPSRPDLAVNRTVVASFRLAA